MFRMLGAAVAAVVLSFAGSAGAAVLYQASGTAGHEDTLLSQSEWGALLAENGVIDIALTFTSIPEGASPLAGLIYDSHRKYIDGHEETLNNSDDWFSPGGSGGMRSWQWWATSTGFLLRLTDTGGYHCEDWQPNINCKWDTLKRIQLSVDRYTVGYDVTISSVDGGSAVPEPATWLMLIAGFGLAGAALRRRQAAMFQNKPI